MALTPNWRWFGPGDPVTLKEIRQTGAAGIVSALHHVPAGMTWPDAEIRKHREFIRTEGFEWRVVESLSVHEDIKKRSGQFRQYVDHYKTSIRNLARFGIDTIIYNFMPVLDWLRTDLRVVAQDGAITTKFESMAVAAFDLFILNRPKAAADYASSQIDEARLYFSRLSEGQKDQLTGTVLLGLPGSLEAYTLDEFRNALAAYNDIDDEILMGNLFAFLDEVIPVAESAGVYMAIHPDDPPRSLFGLPRIVNNISNIDRILNHRPSPYHGLALCTGSLGASLRNDPVEMAGRFAGRIQFSHLRNMERDEKGDFRETYPLDGDMDLFAVIEILLSEQQRRLAAGLPNTRMPFRPDHGPLMIPEFNKKGIYPGYSLLGRMRALAELRGMEAAVRRRCGRGG